MSPEPLGSRRFEPPRHTGVWGSLIVTGLLLAALIAGMALARPATVRKAEAERETQIAANEEKAVKALRRIHEAQNHWYNNNFDGNSIADFAADYAMIYQDHVDKQRGGEPPLSKELALARKDAAGGAPYGGYYFCDITADARGPLDRTANYGICAYPAEYGQTGRRTFILDVQGHVFRRETGRAEALTTFPDLATGWEPVKRPGPSPAP